MITVLHIYVESAGERKLINIWRSYGQEKSVNFYRLTMYLA